MDITSIVGIIMGLAAIIGGQILEGGHVSSITQPTAAIIVFGGTFGAALLQFPLKTVLGAFSGVMKVFLGGGGSPEAVIEQIVGFAMKARKNGLIALENDIAGVRDEFLQKALRLMVDGVDPKMLRETMETEIGHLEEEGLLKAKFFEAAGGYAPTVGILGAVLGLIHVMENLADPSKLGSGIAVAFVATVYGVGSANLIFLPMAGKLKLKHQHEMIHKTMALEGILDIQAGVNPHYIEDKLKAYLDHDAQKRMEAKKK